MKKTTKKEDSKPMKEIPLPDKLVERIIKRNEQIEKHKERISFLQELNQEALTSFIEGQDIGVNTLLELDHKKWTVSVFEPEKEKEEPPVKN